MKNIKQTLFKYISYRRITIFCIQFLLLSGCLETKTVIDTTENLSSQNPIQEIIPAATELPIRSTYSPGQIVDYVAQTGDTLPALAAHFNTTTKEILAENPIVPKDVTTLPPGLPMKIPIYYQALWGSPYQILPDSYFIYGPAESGFDPVEFVNSQRGWFKNHIDYPGGNRKVGGEIIEHVARNYSISPRLLLAILEYQTGALTHEHPSSTDQEYLLGFNKKDHESIYQQLVLAANTLNNGYYGWRTGRLTSFEHTDGRLERPDPWQNAASVGIQYYFSQVLSFKAYEKATSENGLIQTYRTLYAFEPWDNNQPHIPGSLVQPAFTLPYETGKTWTLTGGPHTGWGKGDPWAAIDFAPLGVKDCNPSKDWVTAVADGIIIRTDTAFAVLDIDGDGSEETGWTVIYLHLKTDSMVPLGKILKAGDPIGYPSCEGGSSTGTHIHIARKYNGEWITAGDALPFNLDGWIARNGNAPYEGSMVRFGEVAEASTYSDGASVVQIPLR